MDNLAEEMSSGRMSWRQFCAEIAADLKIAPHEVERRYEKQNINKQVVSLAKSLKAKHKVYLASNAHHDFLQKVLDETGLGEVFNGIFISSVLGVTKPHPLFYQKILEETGLKGEECLFIDDIEANITAAKDAGMQGVVFIDNQSSIKQIEQILTDN